MTKVVVYTKPECVQCEYTKKKLAEFRVPFDEIDITHDKRAGDMLRAEGIHQIPYVVTPTDAWTGFKYDKLKGLGHT